MWQVSKRRDGLVRVFGLQLIAGLLSIQVGLYIPVGDVEVKVLEFFD